MRITAVALVLATSIALAQPPKPLTFEVASVRAAQGGKESVEFGPASVTMRNVRLKACIREAYGVQEPQVIGPDWLGDAWFDIFAKSASGASKAELREMLRTLLADRFKLTVHRDSKELQALILTVSKSGHKLQAVDTEGSPSFETGNLNLTGRGATIGQMCDFIARQLHDPVIDQTGLTGRYNYFLDIQPYFSEESRKATGPNGGPPPDAQAIIAVAVQKELGLKAESKKVPVEVIVVDHVEKTPSEN
jgi:uncharacterized protein (TIGR03435 family)